MKNAILLAFLAVFTLAGCSGGGKSSAVESYKTLYSLDVQLIDGDGQPVRTLKEDQQVTIQARVNQTIQQFRDTRLISQTTQPAEGVIVQLATDGGSMDPPSGEVLTDSDGQATAVLTAGDVAGAFVVTAESEGQNSSWNYEIAEVLKPRLEISIDAPVDGGYRLQAGTDYEITVKAYRESSSSLEVAAGVAVTMGSDAGVWEPSNASAITDEMGKARFQLRPGYATGSYQVTAAASFDDEDVSSSIAIQVSVPEIFMSPLSVDNPTLSAGGTTTLTTLLHDAAGNPWTPVTEVTFSSRCASQGLAELTTTVFSVNGVVEGTYHATGCSGTDVIEASAAIEGVVLPVAQQAEINIQPAELGSIRFIENEPQTLSLMGSGGNESGKVTFQVLDELGNPAANVPVSFMLIGHAAQLLNNSAISGFDGKVSAQLNAGSRAGTVRVMASIDGSDITTQSGSLAVSTGTPDQNSFSLSFSTLSPEAWNFDGVETEITVRAADHFNNWVPDGSVVYFWAEGGSIQPSCVTQNGSCTVSWISQSPRPDDGRVTILARTVGDESYVDTNGNGQRDEGEPFGDLPEAWLDADEDGERDDLEEFADFDGDGSYDHANGVFDGLLCNDNCGASRGVDVRAAGVLVMSTSYAEIEINPDPIYVTNVNSQLVTVHVSDGHGNMMPGGTKVELSTGNGSINGTTSYEIGTTNSPGPFTVQVIVEADDTPSQGLFVVTVTTPSGVVTTAQAIVTDNLVDPCGFSPQPPECLADRTVGAISINPADIQVVANSNTNEQVQLQVIDTDSQPMQQVQVVGQCDATSSNDINATVGTIPETDQNGRTVVTVSISTAASPAGVVRCTFETGGQSTELRIHP